MIIFASQTVPVLGQQPRRWFQPQVGAARPRARLRASACAAAPSRGRYAPLACVPGPQATVPEYAVPTRRPLPKAGEFESFRTFGHYVRYLSAKTKTARLLQGPSLNKSHSRGCCGHGCARAAVTLILRVCPLLRRPRSRPSPRSRAREPPPNKSLHTKSRHRRGAARGGGRARACGRALVR